MGDIFTDYLPKLNSVNNPAPNLFPTYSSPNNMARSGTIQIIDDVKEIPDDIPFGTPGIFILKDSSKLYILDKTLDGIDRKEYTLSTKVEEEKSDIESMIDSKIQKAMTDLRREFRHKNAPKRGGSVKKEAL